jgi:hypothetical protein
MEILVDPDSGSLTLGDDEGAWARGGQTAGLHYPVALPNHQGQSKHGGS